MIYKSINKNKLFFSLALLSSLLVVLPSCSPLDWFKKNVSDCSGCAHHTPNPVSKAQEPNVVQQLDAVPPTQAIVQSDVVDEVASPALVTRGDKPLLSLDQFNDFWQMVLESDPNTRVYLEMNPEAKTQVFSTQAKQKAALEWFKEQGFEDAAFKKKLALQDELTEQALAWQRFQDYIIENQLNFTDKQLQDFYDQNKTENPLFQQQPFLEQTEGVKAKGIAFANEQEAQKFLEKAQAKNANFDALALGAALKVRDFGSVNSRSYGVDAEVRSKLLELADFPQVFLVKGDEENQFWVVQALSKQAAEYAPFDKVKDVVRQVMTQEKYPEAEAAQFEKISKDLDINIRSNYFDEEIQQNKAKVDELIKSLQAAQQSQQDGATQAQSDDILDIDQNNDISANNNVLGA